MIKRILATLALVILTLGAGLGTGIAQADLSAAKSQGLVGERPDGLVGIVVDSVPTDVRAMVDRINDERRSQYQEVAQRTGQNIAQVQAVAGDRLVQATPGGQFVMNAAGRWVKK